MKIICIGRNYAEHAAELHEQLNDSGKLPEEPMFFLCLLYTSDAADE